MAARAITVVESADAGTQTVNGQGVLATDAQGGGNKETR